MHHGTPPPPPPWPQVVRVPWLRCRIRDWVLTHGSAAQRRCLRAAEGRPDAVERLARECDMAGGVGFWDGGVGACVQAHQGKTVYMRVCVWGGAFMTNHEEV